MEYHAVQSGVLLFICCQTIAFFVDIGVQIPHSETWSVYGDNHTDMKVTVKWICDRQKSSEFRLASQLYSRREKQFDILVSANGTGNSLLKVTLEQQGRQDECWVLDSGDVLYRSSFLYHTSQVIKTLKWNSLTVLTDTNNSHMADRFVDHLSRHAIQMEVVVMQGDTDFLNLLVNGTASIFRLRFLVACSVSCLRKALEAAMEYDKHKGQGSLFRHFSYWLLLVEDSYLHFIKGMDVLLDHVAIINLPVSLKAEIVQHVKRVATDSLSICYEREELAVHDIVHRLKADTPPKEVEIRTLLWKTDGRRFSPVRNKPDKKDIFPNADRGLNGRKLTAGILEWLPFARRLEINGSVVYTQACIDVIDHLSKALNFSYSLKEPPDNEWGRPMPNDSEYFTGLIGMLQRQDADIIVVPLGMADERTPIVEFLPQMYSAYHGIIMKKQMADTLISSSLTDPFRWEVFVVGAAVFFGVIVLYMYVEYVNPYYITGSRRQGYLYGTMDTVMMFYGATVHQGAFPMPMSCSSRVLLGFWWLFLIVMTSTYTGNLIATLTVVKEKRPFETMAEAAQDAHVQLGLWEGSIIHRDLETSTISGLQALWRKVQTSADQDKRALATDGSVHIERVLQGGYGYITDSLELTIFERTLCDVFIIPEYILPARYSMTLRKDSPLRGLFETEFLQVTESGLLQHVINKWMPEKGSCPQKPEVKQIITIRQISAAFLAIGIGVLCAVLCLVIEVTPITEGTRSAQQGPDVLINKKKKNNAPSITTGKGKW